MEIKVGPTVPAAPTEHTTQLQQTDNTFKFTLVSHVEEQELKAKLTLLMEEITQQGKKITKRKDVRDMRKYRSLIKDFMNEIINHSHEFSRENFLDRKGRHRVYGIIKLVDKNLDDLAAELMKEDRKSVV